MTSQREQIEFVNRNEEMEALRGRIFPAARKPTITFLISPTGYGKTRLTDRLIEMISAEGPACVVVDPAIRSRSRSDRIYAWFFVQRAADPRSFRSVAGRHEYRSFAKFLKRSPFSKINWKHHYENLKEALSPSKLMRFVIELGENLIKVGRYSSEALLQDDNTFATQLAQDYVRRMANFRPTLFVVRECQNIDPESLNFFVTLGRDTWQSYVICEYTSPQHGLSPEHHAIVFDSIEDRNTLQLIPLPRLDPKEFKFLVRKYTRVDQKQEVGLELKWDGNLRIIKELNNTLMIGRAGAVSPSLVLDEAIRYNLEFLSEERKLIIAIATVHVEAIGQDTLIGVIKLIRPFLTGNEIVSQIVGLANEEKYIEVKARHISLSDEDLLDAVNSSPSMMRVLRLAEASLRDFYLDFLKGQTYASVPLHAALRQAIALCAQTGEIVALRRLIKTLDATVREAVDQTLYINIIADAVSRRDDLLESELREFVDWVSGAAYEVSDFPAAISLLEKLQKQSNFDMALLACCYGEVNRLDEAVMLAHRIASRANDKRSDSALAAKLIELVNIAAQGKKPEARELHMQLRTDAKFSKSALFGFVLRYTEVIEEFPACVPDVLRSIESLQKHGFRKAAAYSQMSAAVYLAFQGRIETARQLIGDAKAELLPYVRDRQIIFNNSVVVDLLSSAPDIKWCIDMLNLALSVARDEYNRFVIQTNRLICYWLLEDYTKATYCADILESILVSPAFGHRGAFWPACFNCWKFFTAVGNRERAEYFRVIPLKLGFEGDADEGYWKTRFDLQARVPPEFNYLMQFKYHPEYLSHWLIDLEGLALLKAANGR